MHRNTQKKHENVCALPLPFCKSSEESVFCAKVSLKSSWLAQIYVR